MSDIINPVELTSELIRCESITPKSDGSIDLIISYLEPLGFTCTKIDFGEGNEKVENLYAKFGNLDRKTLARTSQTPGRTRQLIFFDLTYQNNKLRLVDLPGYGYAKAPKKDIQSWTSLRPC